MNHVHNTESETLKSIHETLTSDVASGVAATVEGISQVLASTKFLCSDIDSISDSLKSSHHGHSAITKAISNTNLMLQKLQSTVDCIDRKVNALQELINDIQQNMSNQHVSLAD